MSEHRGVFGRRWPTPEADVRLDPYRRAAAHLLDGEQIIGLLLIRVVSWWLEAGPFWRRQLIDARELPEWALWRVSPTQVLAEFDDGVIPADALDSELEDWSADTFMLQGRRFRLVWLQQEEADAAHRECGWGRTAD